MKPVTCGVCQGRAYHLKLTLRDLQRNLPGEFSLVRCDTCGFYYLNPQPEWPELQPHYAGDYLPHQVKIEDGIVGSIQHTGIRRKVQLVRQFSTGGRLLDVGCGAGHFLASMQAAGGWDCQGVEPVRAAAQAASQQAGVPVFCGTLQQAQLAADSVDVVTLWDVLEHVAAPLEELGEIYRILKPGGLAVIGTPDPHTLGASIFGACWSIYDAPRHLGLFPRRVMEQTLDKLAFQRLRVRYLSGEYYAFFASLAGVFLLGGHPRAAAACWRASQSVALRLVTFPVFYLPAVLGVGSSPVYIAAKKAI